jgi:hypothetical protein
MIHRVDTAVKRKSRHHSAGQNYHTKAANKYLEHVVTRKIFRNDDNKLKPESQKKKKQNQVPGMLATMEF